MLKLLRFCGHSILWEPRGRHAEFKNALLPEFRRRIVELVESGRTPEDLAREYELSAESIRDWVKQIAGERQDSLTTDERDELNRLRREVRQLKEREVLKSAAAWFARETEAMPC